MDDSVGIICIIIMILLNQICLTLDFDRTKNQLNKLQDSTNLVINRTDTIINRTDTILTILKD